MIKRMRIGYAPLGLVSLVLWLIVSGLFQSCTSHEPEYSLKDTVETALPAANINVAFKKQRQVLQLEEKYSIAYNNADLNAVPVIINEAIALQKSALAARDTVLAVEAGTLAGRILAEINQYSMAQSVLEPVLKLAAKKYLPGDQHMLELKEYLSWAYGGQNDYDRELMMTDDLISVKMEDSVSNASKIADLLNTKGMNLGFRGDRYMEQFYLNQARSILEPKVTGVKNVNPEDFGYLLNVYNSISISYVNSGDFENAILFADKAMEMRDKIAPNTPQQAISLMVKARADAALSAYPVKGLEFINRALSLLQPGTAAYYSYSGIKLEILNKLHQFDEARQLVDEVSASFEKIPDPSSELAETFTRFLLANARGLQAQSFFNDAGECLEDCIVLLNKYPQLRNLLRLAIYCQAAEVSRLQNVLPKARKMFDLSLAAAGVNDANAEKIIASLTIHTPWEIQELMSLYASFTITENPGDVNVLKSSVTIQEKILSVREAQQQWLYDMGIHEGPDTEMPKMGERLLDGLYELNRIEPDRKHVASAIRVMELCKANLLDEDRSADAMFERSLPEELNARRVRLRASVFGALNAWRSEPTDEKKQEMIMQSNQYKQFLDSVQQGKNNYGDDLSGEDYYALMLNNPGCTINYFLGQRSLYACVSANNTIRFDKKVIDDVQRDKLQRLANAFKGNFTDLRPDELSGIDTLLKETALFLLRKEDLRQSLTVIPHDILSSLSFESLDIAGVGTGSTYVIELCPVRYLPTLTMLSARHTAVKKKRAKYFGGFAASKFGTNKKGVKKLPELATRGVLSDLKGTEEEISRAAIIMNGEEYQHTTRNIFLKNVADYRVVLVGTHALVHRGAFDESAFIFEEEAGEKNYVNELDIAPLRLNAELMVLSACNTGQGKMHATEGPLSLGRAFFQTGCPAVVMGLWPLNDQSTSEITGIFFEKIRDGLPKHIALQQAKREYLKSVKDPYRKHPYFWAGLVLAGDTDPVKGPAEGKNPWIWGSMFGLGALLVHLAFKRFRSN